MRRKAKRARVRAITNAITERKPVSLSMTSLEEAIKAINSYAMWRNKALTRGHK